MTWRAIFTLRLTGAAVLGGARHLVLEAVEGVADIVGTLDPLAQVVEAQVEFESKV